MAYRPGPWNVAPLVRDAAYTLVGFAVVHYQRMQVQRRALEKRFQRPVSRLTEGFSGLLGTLTSLVRGTAPLTQQGPPGTSHPPEEGDQAKE